ncbi:MAG: hypothetical protein QMC86_04180 [Methanothermobacter sp.]|nr:hypothetical protein [Methanothermobacter sp.]
MELKLSADDHHHPQGLLSAPLHWQVTGVLTGTPLFTRGSQRRN